MYAEPKQNATCQDAIHPHPEEGGDFWHHTVKYDSNVSYGTLFDYAENFWMLLYFAGYLTECAAAESAGRKIRA